MILDKIRNATHYASLHPNLQHAFYLMQQMHFHALPDGEISIKHQDIRLFIGKEPMRTRHDAKPEQHRHHIDIQIPISSDEEYGWIDAREVKNGLGYNETRDIEFFDCAPTTWLTVSPDEFILFFPHDAHAPLVGNHQWIRKAVFKIFLPQSKQ